MTIKAYAVKELGGKLEPFEYDPGALGSEENEAMEKLRSGKPRYRLVLKH